MKTAKELVLKVADAKMLMNEHKGNITDVDFDRLLSMLRDEIDELELAIGTSNQMNAIEEAADAVNYILAIVDKTINLYRERKYPK